jgi:hypothetical protein
LWLCLLPGASSLLAETHANLQSINADGTSAWSGSFPFTLQGVILNDPAERLEGAPAFLPWDGGANAFRMGGEWEVFIQSVDPLDRGGTACWMGQNYGNLPWLHDEFFSYSDAEWLAETQRLNHDPANRHRFRKGDLVEVTVKRSLFYAGKQNVNEAHDRDPSANFELRLLHADYGLPEPELITLADLVNPDDGDLQTHEDIFDETRATGGERYQGMRVRINALTLVDGSGWGETEWSLRKCLVTDGSNRFFTLRMPLTDLGPAPDTGTVFDAIGVMDQDSGSSSDGTHGYNLFVQEIYIAGGPRIQISDDVVLRWPAPAGSFVLEGSDDPAGSDWAPVTNATILRSDSLTIAIVPRSGPQKFYRLRSE